MLLLSAMNRAILSEPQQCVLPACLRQHCSFFDEIVVATDNLEVLVHVRDYFQGVQLVHVAFLTCAVEILSFDLLAASCIRVLVRSRHRRRNAIQVVVTNFVMPLVHTNSVVARILTLLSLFHGLKVHRAVTHVPGLRRIVRSEGHLAVLLSEGQIADQVALV